MSGPAVARAGDEAFVWRRKFEDAFDRVWALETAFVRRLARHNTGEENAHKPACFCGECAWLRTLFDDDLGARLRKERRTPVTDLNFAESLAQHIEKTEAAVAEAEGRIHELKRRIADQRRQLAALKAAHRVYARRLDAQRRVAVPVSRRREVDGWLRAVVGTADDRGTVRTIELRDAGLAAGVWTDKKTAATVIGQWLRRNGYDLVCSGVYRRAA